MADTTPKIDTDDPTVILAYTDGSCYPNPRGTGGWSFFVSYRGKDALRYGSRANGIPKKLVGVTNNQMELLALLQCLRFVPAGKRYTNPFLIFTDSKYVRNALTEWLPEWKAGGWKTSVGRKVKNRKLLEELDVLYELHRASRLIEVRWVRGHSGIPENELVDSHANLARKTGKTNWVPERDHRNNI